VRIPVGGEKEENNIIKKEGEDKGKRQKKKEKKKIYKYALKYGFNVCP